MTSRSSILVVDDEQGVRDFIRKNLTARGFTVHLAANGLEALAILNTEQLNLIVLDLMMPSMDGLEAARRIRQISSVPIIILTALGEDQDKVTALDLGADDYLTKPFGVDELLARVRVALRRVDTYGAPATGPVVNLGGPSRLEVDLAARLVRRGGQEVHVTRTEYELLAYLTRNLGRVVTQRELLQRVWGPEYGSESDYLRTFVRQLRKKLEPDPAEPTYILTVSGVGYRLRRP